MEILSGVFPSASTVGRHIEGFSSRVSEENPAAHRELGQSNELNFHLGASIEL
jgi:hypothetical protein